MMKIHCNVCSRYRKFKYPETYILKKALSLSIVLSTCGPEYKYIFNEEESVEILKILGLITNIEQYQKIYNHD